MITGTKLIGLLLFGLGFGLGIGNMIHRRRNPEGKRRAGYMIGALLLEVAGIVMLVDGCA